MHPSLVITSCLRLLSGLIPADAAEPTELREWRAASGHRTQARALSATERTVKLKLTTGKTIDLAIEKLAADQRSFGGAPLPCAAH